MICITVMEFCILLLHSGNEIYSNPRGKKADVSAE